jgi:hypothetical protein
MGGNQAAASSASGDGVCDTVGHRVLGQFGGPTLNTVITKLSSGFQIC